LSGQRHRRTRRRGYRNATSRSVGGGRERQRGAWRSGSPRRGRTTEANARPWLHEELSGQRHRRTRRRGYRNATSRWFATNTSVRPLNRRRGRLRSVGGGRERQRGAWRSGSPRRGRTTEANAAYETARLQKRNVKMVRYEHLGASPQSHARRLGVRRFRVLTFASSCSQGRAFASVVLPAADRLIIRSCRTDARKWGVGSGQR
jgi:hypothetical protein